MSLLFDPQGEYDPDQGDKGKTDKHHVVGFEQIDHQTRKAHGEHTSKGSPCVKET